MRSRRQLLAATVPVALAVALPAPTRSAALNAPDGAILEAFGRWAAQMRALDAMAADADDDTFSDACDVADEIVSEIAAMPAAGMAGVAVKAFLLAHDRYGGARGNSLKLGAALRSDDSRGGGLHRSLLADVGPWVPAV